MKLIEDRELDEVAGANAEQKEVFDFVERVMRESQRMLNPLSEPTGF